MRSKPLEESSVSRRFALNPTIRLGSGLSTPHFYREMKNCRLEANLLIGRAFSSWGKKCQAMLSSDMTVKQQIHHLVDELPDDSPLLIEVREALRINHAIGEAMEDVRDGRTYGAEDFMAKVQQRWPRKSSE
jgi:hypothetical protein